MSGCEMSIDAENAASGGDMGESCTMELRGASNLVSLCNTGTILMFLETLSASCGFQNAHISSVDVCQATRSRVFMSAGAEAHVVLRTFPDLEHATMCVYLREPAATRRTTFFKIYDFSVEFFRAEYSSECLSFVEHHA